MAQMKAELDIFVTRSELMGELAQPSRLLFVAADLLPDDETRASFRQKLEDDLQKVGGACFSEFLKRMISEWRMARFAAGQKSTLETLTSSLSSNGFPELAEMIKCDRLPSSMPITIRKKRENSSERMLIKRRRSSAKEDPVTKALSNPLVLGEIFKKLSFEDQKKFRLVNHSWWLETVKYNWRKSVWLNLRSTAEAEQGCITSPWMSVKDLNQRFSNAAEDVYHLKEFPYRCYTFWESTIQPPLPTNSHQTAFWNSIGPQMTSLMLNHCYFNVAQGIINTLRWLLLEACPNLEELIVFAFTENRRFDEKGNGGDRGGTETSVNRQVRKDYATKLKCLELVLRPDRIDATEFFKLLPNLKVFHGLGDNDLDGMETRLPNGNYIQLERLILGDAHINSHYHPWLFDFHSLLTYSTTVSPSTITHLELSKVDMLSARDEPFEMYRALYNFRSNLKTMKLWFVDIDGAKVTKWFLDISFIEFPKLTNFELRFDAERCSGPEYIFDFATLKGMLNLEEFSLRYTQTAKYLSRGPPATGDWIYRNDDQEIEQRLRNRFVPEELRQEQPYPHLLQNIPLHLPKLKKLRFRGFPLTLEDIGYFHLWFPNLAYFEAAFNRDAIREVLRTWEGLETLRVIPLLERTSDVDLQVLCKDFPLVNIGFAVEDDNDNADNNDDNSDDGWSD